MDEAGNENCRVERSRRIYQQLDEWLKEELRIAIHEQVTYKRSDYAKPKKNAIRKKNEKMIEIRFLLIIIIFNKKNYSHKEEFVYL